MTSRRKQYDEYINSERWRLKRVEYFRADEGHRRCAGCGYSGIGLHVHHRTYRNLGNEPFEDLVAVCVRCHRLIHQGVDSWNERLEQHTDNVLAEIRRKVSGGQLKPTTSWKKSDNKARPKRPVKSPRRRKKRTGSEVPRDPATSAFHRMRAVQAGHGLTLEQNRERLRKINGL